MVDGATEMEAVGDGGGGGGGGGGGAAFFLHAPSIRRALRAKISTTHFIRECFTWFLLRPRRARRSYVLFPTPIRLGITPRKSQLLKFLAGRQHAPDLQTSGTIRLKHYMPSIR